ncbi:MAG: hypothetical protein M1166_07565 [Candidatus Thermoplasmatota archaeon]|nr:hypothetical protein [Candidatus Thermoplasmatota archaeon]
MQAKEVSNLLRIPNKTLHVYGRDGRTIIHEEISMRLKLNRYWDLALTLGRMNRTNSVESLFPI